MRVLFLPIIGVILIVLGACGIASRDSQKTTGVSVWSYCEGDCKCISKLTGSGTLNEDDKEAEISQPSYYLMDEK